MAYAVIDSVAEGNPGKAVWANGVRSNQEDHETSIGALEVSDGTQNTRFTDIESDIVDLETSDGTQNTRITALEGGGGGVTDWTTGDTTPSVLGGGMFRTDNTADTTVSSFDDMTAGDIATLIVADSYTILDGDLTKTGMEIPLIIGDSLQWVHDGTSAVQIAGTVGMGQWVYLADADAISDWIAGTQTTYADVDVSDDGVRKGANSVKVRLYTDDMSTEVRLKARAKGSSADGIPEIVGGMNGGSTTQVVTFAVGLNDSAVFEAKFDASVTYTNNNAAVVGYWI